MTVLVEDGRKVWRRLTISESTSLVKAVAIYRIGRPEGIVEYGAVECAASFHAACCCQVPLVTWVIFDSVTDLDLGLKSFRQVLEAELRLVR